MTRSLRAATHRRQIRSRKKDAVKVQAERDQKTYDSLNFRDGPFDLSDAALAISMPCWL